MDETEFATTSMCAMAESLSSHQYKSYQVELTHRLRTNTDVQLGTDHNQQSFLNIYETKIISLVLKKFLHLVFMFSKLE